MVFDGWLEAVVNLFAESGFENLQIRTGFFPERSEFHGERIDPCFEIIEPLF